MRNHARALALIATLSVSTAYAQDPKGDVAWDLLASLAAFAGCHLFADRGDVLYANESFVAVHADGDGRRTIRFKRPCSPYEVYEKRFYGNGVEKIDVAMRHGQTLMWSLGELAGA